MFSYIEYNSLIISWYYLMDNMLLFFISLCLNQIVNTSPLCNFHTYIHCYLPTYICIYFLLVGKYNTTIDSFIK